MVIDADVLNDEVLVAGSTCAVEYSKTIIQSAIGKMFPSVPTDVVRTV